MIWDFYFQLEEWEDHDRKLSKFIRTNTKPHIFYLPAKHNDYTMGLLEKTAGLVEGKFGVRVMNCGFRDDERKDVIAEGKRDTFFYKFLLFLHK